MSKTPKTPTLFQIAHAHKHGFRPLRLLFSDPHYVRVVVDEKREIVVVTMLLHTELHRVRPYKADGDDTWWYVTGWGEDEILREHLRSLIFKHANSHELPQTFRFNADDTLLVMKR